MGEIGQGADFAAVGVQDIVDGVAVHGVEGLDRFVDGRVGAAHDLQGGDRFQVGLRYGRARRQGERLTHHGFQRGILPDDGLLAGGRRAGLLGGNLRLLGGAQLVQPGLDALVLCGGEPLLQHEDGVLQLALGHIVVGGAQVGLHQQDIVLQQLVVDFVGVLKCARRGVVRRLLELFLHRFAAAVDQDHGDDSGGNHDNAQYDKQQHRLFLLHHLGAADLLRLFLLFFFLLLFFRLLFLFGRGCDCVRSGYCVRAVIRAALFAEQLLDRQLQAELLLFILVGAGPGRLIVFRGPVFRRIPFEWIFQIYEPPYTKHYISRYNVRPCIV